MSRTIPVEGVPETPGTQPRSIRWHLFQVLLVCIVPIGIFGAGLLYTHWKAQERQHERLQIETTRLLATAVDNAIDSSIQRLQIFAALWASADTMEAEVYQLATQTLANTPDWSNILAFHADGTSVFRLDRPYGAPKSDVRLLGFYAPVLRDRQTMVSDLFMSPARNIPIVTVAVPVIRDGQVTHLLMAALNFHWYDELLRKQGLAEGGVAAIFDRNLKLVARSTAGDKLRGVDPGLGDTMKAAGEKAGRFPTRDGIESYVAWAPTRHGWTVVIATPSAPIEGVFWKHMLLFGSLWSAVLAAGIALALFKGKHITESLQSLETGAAQLAQGKRLPVLVSSQVAEVDQAKAALEQAGTVLARAMAEREQALSTERDARAAAEAANRAKDEFLAMLGHELRNPLAAISNAVTIVRSELHTPEQLKFAGEVIARQSQHLKRLIDDLLDVGRVMTGKIMISRSPLDLATSVRHVASTLRTAGRLTDRVIEIDAESAWVSGDQTRIEQIVTNLLVNAATYTAPGARIGVEVRGTQELATLRVTDDGIGISADNLPRVFDLFFQAEPTAERAHSGLGIGLTLVRRLVELHGGSVTAASEGKGKGATFEVRLPAVPEAAPRQSASAVTKPASRRVLIVEDNADERDSLRVALELQGHDVLQASNGLAALDVVRRERPPVAVIDIGLPGMDGYRLARTIRGEMQRGILLIALTGYGAESDARRALEAGFDLHLTKPVDVEDLATLVSPRKTGETAGLQGRSVG